MTKEEFNIVTKAIEFAWDRNEVALSIAIDQLALMATINLGTHGRPKTPVPSKAQ